uniref:Uncharacterized protein n=1 Tax=Cyclocybe aegerita TaxID=1973307 RepID=A0A884P6I8_CYCAE|nr:hypothetical protein K4014_mgp24 [Cyclocybe aegerita]QQP21452.1 hypothetical protein [Cyclocybe aegerita]
MKNTKYLLMTSYKALPVLNTNISSHLNKWINQEYKIETPTLITKALLSFYIDKFYKDVINNIDENQHFLFILRGIFEDNQPVSFFTIQKINKECKKELLNYLFNRISISNDFYLSTPLKSIVFSYRKMYGKIKSDLIVENRETVYHTYYRNKLPVAFNPSEYGKILIQNGKSYTIAIDNKNMINLEQTTIDNKKVNIVHYFKNNQLLFVWKDIYIDEENINREIGKSIYHFRDKSQFKNNNYGFRNYSN